MGDGQWRRIAGFRVVVSWPQDGVASPPSIADNLRARLAGVAGVLLLAIGAAAVGFAVSAQQHAPQPSRANAGALGPAH